MLIKMGAFVTAIITGIIGAVVATKLWEWFVVPLGMPAIGVAHAYGLLLLFTMHAVARNALVARDDSISPNVAWLGCLFTYTMAFIFGAVAKWFMG